MSHTASAASLRQPARPVRHAEAEATPGPIDFDRAPVGVKPAPGGVQVGRVVAIDERGQPWVECPALSEEKLIARAAIAAGDLAIDSQVVLAFENADPGLPIILGVLASPSSALAAVRRDGERFVLTADKEIVLECGEASITLTKAGKVIIRGAYVVTRSTGVNRIKGASVQIN